MYLTQNGRKLCAVLFKEAWFAVFLYVLFLSPFASKAQTAVPVDAVFSGEWIFDSAQAQERNADSQQDYATRSVLQNEFWQKSHLLNIPTGIVFRGDFMAHISHPSWSKPVIAVINNGMLEFRHFQENPEDYPQERDMSGIDSYPVMMPAYLLALNGGLMSLQCNYTCRDTQGKYLEGILTVYYKRF